MTMNLEFKGFAKSRLASVEETILLFSNLEQRQTATGPAYMPLWEIRDEAHRLGESLLAKECEYMLDQVMNLFQADFPQRPVLATAIQQQARNIEDLLAV